MKFVLKLSVLVAVLVFVLGVYKVSTTKAEVMALDQVSSTEKSSGLLSGSSNAAGPGRPSFRRRMPAPAQVAPPASRPVPGVPTRVSIPAAGIDSPVISVGLTAGGDMDVPSGSSNNVGWYKGGTVPGTTGSAVLDAHVFAALKNLHLVKAGDDIYIDITAGGRLHFRVESAVFYKLADVPDDTLFNRADQPRLNLITCAGTYIPSQSTYDHRLVVYAVLVK